MHGVDLLAHLLHGARSCRAPPPDETANAAGKPPQAADNH
jgi:hypothetical protein